MAEIFYYDRVKDTSNTTGTGTLTLANSPPTGSVAFSVIGDGNSCYFLAYSSDNSQWEINKGVYTASGFTLSRDGPIASSNSNNLVNFTLALTVELIAPSSIFNLAQLSGALAAHRLCGGL
jgi:hypothetical protein